MAQLMKIGKMWYSDIRVGGKRLRRALSVYRPKAQKMLQDMVELRRSMKHGTIPSDVSWNFFKERYHRYGVADLSPRTVVNNDIAFTMVEEVFPITQLRQMTPEMMELIKFKWKEKGETLSMISRSLCILKAAMHKAEDWRYISPQNWRSVKVVRPNPRLIYFSIEEIQRLLRVAKKWPGVYTDIMLQVRAGLRSGEAYHLEWGDIDFERHQIWIHRKVFWRPKMNKERYVPMVEDLEVFLKSIRRPSGFVFNDDRPDIYTFYWRLKKTFRIAKLKGTAHALRHTFASHLVQAGCSIKIISGLLGHGSVRMTEVYAHLAPSTLQNGLQYLPALCSTLRPVQSEQRKLSVA